MSKVGFGLPLPASDAASSEERKPLPGATLLRKASYPVPKYTIAMEEIRSPRPVLPWDFAPRRGYPSMSLYGPCAMMSTKDLCWR